MSRLAWMVGLTLLASDGAGPSAHFRYERSVVVTGAGESCAVLEPLIFAHAAESLTDLRLLRTDGGEVPYALTESGTAGVENVTARVRNLIGHGSGVSFDLTMPARAYTDVVLDLAGTDFVATALVSGSGADGVGKTPLGQFAVFDLSAQHLPRSTVLALQETTLPVLHVELRAAPGSRPMAAPMVRGATVPPSREAQTLYTTAVRSSAVQQRGQQTVVTLAVPPRVPIERVRVELAPEFYGNFERAVRIEARGDGDAETISGVIAQLHMQRDGLLLAMDRRSMAATLGANLQTAATVSVAIENGGRCAAAGAGGGAADARAADLF